MAYSPVGVVDKNIWDFDPRIIPGCVLWLDGADTYTQFTNTGATTVVTETGQSINAWRDKSINALTFTTDSIGANTTAPTSAFNSQNGRPTISFTTTGGVSPPTAGQGLRTVTNVSRLPNGRAGGTYFAVSRAIEQHSIAQTIFTYGSSPTATGQTRQFYYGNSGSFPGSLYSDVSGTGRSSDGTDFRNNYSILSNNMTAMSVIGATNPGGGNTIYSVTNTHALAVGNAVTISGIAGGTFTGFNGTGTVQTISPNTSITVNISSTGTPTDFRAAIISGNNNGFNNGESFSLGQFPDGENLASMNVGTARAAVGYGLDGSTNTWWLNGNIAEILVYNNVLTTSERQQIEGYLAWKWGLQSNLVDNHPYKNTYSIIRPLLRPFVPTDVSTRCLLWFDGADATTVGLSGSSVSSWNDKSGNANNIPSFVSPVPTYDPNTSNFLTFSVAGVNAGIGTTTNTVSLTTTASYSIFYVVRFPAALPSTGALLYLRVFQQSTGSPGFFAAVTRSAPTATPTANYYLESNFGAGPYYFFANNLGVNALANNILVCSISRRSTSGFSDLSVMNGNTSVDSGTLRTSTMQQTSRVNIGSAGRDGGITMSYGIGEVLFYDGALSTQDRQRVEGYLAWKWGAQRIVNASFPNFPTTHPMYNFPSATVVPFSPTVHGNLLMWYDGADTSSLTLSGSTITAWNDKSGNSNNLTVAVGPTRTATSSNPAGWDVSFNGSTQYIRSNSLAVTNGRNTMTVFIVVKNTASSITGRIIAGITSGPETTENGAFRFANAATNSIAITKGSLTGTQDGTNYTISSDVYHIITITWNGAANSPVFVDGSLNGTYSANSNTTFSFTRFGLGASLGTSPNFTPATFWTGSLNEVIIYNAVLMDSQRQQVEGYLAWKWGLNASLPTTHPYYKVPT